MSVSDSTYLFSDPFDAAWEKEKLEPDDLEIPVEIEGLVPDFGDEDLIGEEADGSKERGLRSVEDMWNDLALDEFILDAQRERVQQTQNGPSDPVN